VNWRARDFYLCLVLLTAANALAFLFAYMLAAMSGEGGRPYGNPVFWVIALQLILSGLATIMAWLNLGDWSRKQRLMLMCAPLIYGIGLYIILTIASAGLLMFSSGETP